MTKITFFHRSENAGFSINKVSQTFIRELPDKEEFYVPYLGGSIVRVVKNTWFIFKHRSKNGINHITGDIHYGILGLIGTKKILTIHDTGMVDDHKFGFLKRILLEWIWVRLPLMFATKIVCISNVTKQHVQKYTKRTDIEVIHNAVDSSFKTIQKNQTERPKKVLIIGTGTNKNIERTILALAGIDCTLTIIGKLSSEQIACLEKSNIEYINKKNLSDEELRYEYENTDIVSFISLFEGFGMPIIEANKVGRPVITSTIPVIKEVANDSCVFVNPENIKEMHEGFARLFNDASLRQQCVERGLENVKRFEVQNIVRQWEKLYKSLA